MSSGADHLGASGNVRGAVFMTMGMLGFVTNDMFAKLASNDLPIGEIVFIRGLFTTVIIGAIALATGALAKLGELRRPAVALRTLGEMCSTVLFLTALFNSPIANATAILQAVPIVMTGVAAIFLGEAVGWRRWLAVIVGFAGMLMIVQPGGTAFNAYSLFAVGAVFTMTLRDLATRWLPLAVPAILVTLVSAIAVMLTGAALGLAENWRMPGLATFGYLMGSAISLTGGLFFLVEAMRNGEMSAISPFRYTILIPAFVYGIFIWGETPNAVAVTGIILVAASGLYVFYREGRQRAARKAAEEERRL